MVVFSNIYNHWIRDEFLNFENVIYDFFDPSGFDGVIVTAEAFLDISTTKPRREICEVFVLCILSLLSPKTYGVFPQGKNHFQQILYLRLSYHKLVLLRIFCSISLRHHLCLSVTLQFNLRNNLLLCKKSTDLKSQWILIFSSKNLIRVSITPPAA